ncbi:hypothetical protein ABG850_05455 [Phocaeicola vulgatus]|jgi:hypothetical protein|uniref:hypothetical protein n=1 Tax=Phocaeicola vulgatus TaxID=821 RepID=UPI00216B0AEB|nr:hypothetical protein [Phocaeicola vulgatus]MDB0988593.1 hypothetical protein [Phocaeicola vulgatus]MDC1639001.1 hypothetical protein [Phocaeicola vulgatus]MDC1643364.1 hypothetical protein [Phocaeicola vulgatus]MDC1651335.1 hypothetical protein [Phocaeicola vulgatus]MDC1655430.1 hypothetical protein [Phocaeicola vulgatus]
MAGRFKLLFRATRKIDGTDFLPVPAEQVKGRAVPLFLSDRERPGTLPCLPVHSGIQFQTFPAFHMQDMPGELRERHDFDSFPVCREEILSCLFHKSVSLRVGNRFV